MTNIYNIGDEVFIYNKEIKRQKYFVSGITLGYTSGIYYSLKEDLSHNGQSTIEKLESELSDSRDEAKRKEKTRLEQLIKNIK